MHVLESCIYRGRPRLATHEFCERLSEARCLMKQEFLVRLLEAVVVAMALSFAACAPKRPPDSKMSDHDGYGKDLAALRAGIGATRLMWRSVGTRGYQDPHLSKANKFL